MTVNLRPVCLILLTAAMLGSTDRLAPGAQPRTNVLLITADDLGYEAVDFLSGKVPDVMPNLTALASQSLSFSHAHVNAAICAPSRGIIATGRYGHNSGLFGFNKLSRQLPTVFGTFQNAGYLTGILGKVSHSTPDLAFQWDFSHDQPELGNGRSPTKYYGYCQEFFALPRRGQAVLFHGQFARPAPSIP